MIGNGSFTVQYAGGYQRCKRARHLLPTCCLLWQQSMLQGIQSGSTPLATRKGCRTWQQEKPCMGISPSSKGAGQGGWWLCWWPSLASRQPPDSSWSDRTSAPHIPSESIAPIQHITQVSRTSHCHPHSVHCCSGPARAAGTTGRCVASPGGWARLVTVV